MVARSQAIDWALSLLLQVLGCVLLYQYASQLGFFVDEIINNEAAKNFFLHLNYSSTILGRPFDVGISSGIAATWPAGLSWLLGGNLLAARLALAFAAWVHFTLLAGYWLRGRKFSWAETALLSSFLWILLMKAIPNWFNFEMALGEFAGALWIASGVFLLERRPRLAALFFGLGVWLAKFIYLPLALVFLAAFFCRHRRGKTTLQMAAIFLFPALAYLALIAFRFGFSELGAWLSDFFQFLHSGNSASSGRESLWSRLHNPALEWLGFGLGIKLRILGLLTAPFMLVFFARIKTIYVFAALFCLAFYAFWWFFFNPFLWIRHLQPALFLAFALSIFFVGTIFRYRKFWVMAFSLAIALSLAFTAKQNWQPSSYAQECTRLAEAECQEKK